MLFRYLQILRSPNSEILSILKQNVIGTPGQSMLYQHGGVDEKINRVQDSYFVNLIRADKVVGTCCFCKRETMNGGRKYSSFYVRYFSFRDAFRRKSISEKSKTGNSLLRAEISAVLSGEGLNMASTEKFFHYAYVDPRNKRSALLCREFGFETIRTYTTVLFSRLNPRELGTIVEADSEEFVKKTLESFYAGYTTFSLENLTHKKYYFIKDAEGQRIAGVQVNPDHWTILSLPGFMGKWMLPFFSRAPLLKKIINKDFHFITLEGLYCRPGSEKYVELLLESLLARYRVNAAICIVDPESGPYKMLKSLRLGLLHAVNKEVKGNVIAKFVNFTKEEIDTFKTNPVYISGVDAT